MSKKGVGWHSEAFRAMAVDRLRTCRHIGKLCEELGVSRGTLRKWRNRKQKQAREEAHRVPASIAVAKSEQENRRLKQALAEKVLEVDFLAGALQQVEARRRPNMASGGMASTPRSGE